MFIRKAKRLWGWKFQYMYRWPTLGLGFEYQHENRIFGVKVAMFMLTVQKLEATGRREV